MIKKYLIRYNKSSKVNPFCDDIILKICELLSDKAKIMFLSTCVSTNKLKSKATYHEKVHVYWIMNLPYFDNFEYVKISQSTDICPKNTKHVHFGKYAFRCGYDISF